MTIQDCTLPAGDLIGYIDGYLSGGRRELVEAHVAVCRHCQERLAVFESVKRLIQDGTPPIDDAAGRAMIRSRLEREAGRGRVAPRLLAVPVLLLLLALALVVGPVPGTEAGFPLGRFIRFAEVEIKQLLPKENQRPVKHVAPSVPDVPEPTFPTVAPTELPLGLVRVERSAPSSERLELLYRNHAGITILVTEAPARPGMITLDASGKEVLVVRGTEILWLKDPRPDAVAALFWERDGVFFDVMVVEAPPGAYGGLKRLDGLQIVEALMAAQDAAQG